MEELEVIVQRMIDAGESEENIKAVIESYDSQGKTNDTVETGAPAVSETGQASESMESDSADTSLGLSIEDFLITPEDLKANEETVSENLNKKLARVGLQSYQTTAFGESDAIKIKKSDEKTASKYLKDAFSFIGLDEWVRGDSSVLDVFDSSKVGSDISDEDINESVEKLNEYIRENANLDYVNQAKKRVGDIYEKEYLPFIQAEDLSKDQLQEKYKEDLIDKFETVERKSVKRLGRDQDFRKVKVPVTADSFDNEEEFEKYKKWKEGNPIEDLSEDDITAYDAKRKYDYAQARSSKFGNKLTETERLDIKALAIDDAEKVKATSEAFNNIVNLYNEETKSYETSLQDYKTNPTLENFEVANSNFKKLLDRQNQIQLLENKVDKENLDEKAAYIPITIQNFNKDFNRLNQLRSGFKRIGADISYGVSQLAIMAGYSTQGFVPTMDYLNEQVEDKTGLVSLGKDIQQESAMFQEDPEFTEIKDLQDVGRWVAGSTTNLIPSLSMAFTGPLALPLFFLSGYGSTGMETAISQSDAAERMLKNKQRLESDEDIDFMERSIIEQQMEEDSKTLNISNWQALSNQALAGAAEIVFERLGTMKLLKGVREGIKGLPPETLKEGFKMAGRTLGKGLTVEGSSELATTITQNFGDIYLMGEDKNLFEGATETFAQGALMGVGINSINATKAIGQAMASEAATIEEVKEMDRIMAKLRELTGVQELQSPENISEMNLDLTPEVQELVDKLTGEANNITNGIFERLGRDLSIEDLYQVGEINRKMRKVNNKFINAVRTGMSPAQLNAFEKELKQEYDTLKSQREAILTNESTIAKNRQQIIDTAVAFENTSGYNTYRFAMQEQNTQAVADQYNKIDSKTKQKGFDQAKNNLIEEGVEAPTLDQIKERAFIDYKNARNSEAIEKGEANAKAFAENAGLNINIQSFEGSKEERKAAIVEAYKNASDFTKLDAEGNVVPMTPAEIDSNIKELEQSIDDGSFEGVQLGNSIIVDKTNSIEKGRTGVFAHEVLHAYAAQKLGSGSLNQSGQALLDYLERYDPDFYALVKFRLDDSYKGRTEYYEEAMNVMSDLIADGVSVQPATTQRLKGFINKILQPLGSKFQFKTEQGAEVLQFVKDFNKQAHFGQQGPVAEFNPSETTTTGGKFSRSKLNQLAKDFKEGKIQADNAELIKQYKRLALSGPGLNFQGYKSRQAAQEGLKAINREDAESFVMQYLPGLLQRFNPKSAEFSTLVISNINPKRQAFYQEEIGGQEVTTRMSDERVGEIADEGPAPFETVGEADTDFKLVDSIKIDGEPLPKPIKDKIREFVTKQTEGKDPFDEKFRKQVFKPSPDFINFIKEEILGGRSLENYKEFIRKNPKFIKGLGIGSLVRFDTGLTKQGKPRLFTEFNRRLTKQKEIEKFMMQGRVAYVTPQQMKSGADLYNRLRPTETQLINFLTGDTAQTVSNRKTAIAKAIATKFIAEATPSTQAFQGRPEAERAKMAEKLQVSPTAKFSESKKIARDMQQVANSKGGITISPIKNTTVKGLNEEGFKTEADLKENLNLPVLGKRGKIEADKDRLLNKSGYRVLKSETSVPVMKEFLEDNPQFTEIINKSTTGSLRRSLFGSPRLFRRFFGQTIVDQVEMSRQVYKEKNRLKKQFVKLTNQKDFLDNQKNKLSTFGDFWLAVEKFLNKEGNKDKAWIFDEMLKDAVNNMNSLNRISPPIFYLPLNEKGEIDFNSLIREEHNFPSNNVGSLMLWAAQNGQVENAMKIVKAAYMQGPILMADDIKLDVNFKTTMPDIFWEEIAPRIINGDLKIEDGLASVIRLTEAGVNLDSYKYLPTNQTMSEYFFGENGLPQEIQAELIRDYLTGKNTLDDIRRIGKALADEYNKLKPGKEKASIVNNNNTPTNFSFSKKVPNAEVLQNLSNIDAALDIARDPNAPVKKIRVFDFDDTLAKSNSRVAYELPDGTTGMLNATEFAQRAGELQEQGAEFDFSEFSKVVDGKKGPVFKAIENIVAKRGAEDVFILTARPADAAGPIKEFMDALGVNIPIENIVGLGDGTAEAKARWMVSKAAEGYNDFFFVDDAYKNVKAVQDTLDVLDVKSKTQQAKVKFSKGNKLDQDFNDIIAAKSGIASEKEYSKAKAEVVGASKGRVFKGIPYSAQDLIGLIYATLSKGKLGDSQMAWYQENLFRPYARAMNDLDAARITMMQDYRALKKQLGVVPKNLRKKIPGETFTREQAVRVYIWNKQGMDVPGLSKADLKELTDYIEGEAELKVFADQLIAIQKGDQYAKPKEGWLAGTITTDLLEGLNTIKRAKYLKQWQDNVDIIFSEKNLNKLEAVYGKGYRKALENMLQRMKTGRNRNFSDDTLTARFGDWLNGSIGVTMFFNTRSAILQTISAINFINFTDNNPLAAAKAFANQKQFWSDFMFLVNSDFLKARRGGLRINVNEADIADMAKKGGPRAVINKLLQLGFAPTQIADSFAIASGGATFYRNRINTYKKQGLSQQEAETKAFEDFRENAEESQQSSRPDRISMQQAGPLGRFILSFANTPAQYARIIDKATRDLIAGRGDAKTNVSKIIYYSTVQNLLFNALQQALFAFAFGDEEPEDEKKKEKYLNVANGMADSILRGTGIGGAAASVIKNAIIRIVREQEKKQPKLEKVGYELTKISPPISAKLSRINQAARSYQWDKDEMISKGFSLDNPAYLAAANVVSALTNVPLDRAIRKANNITDATSSELEMWERLALLGGWQDWEIGIDEENKTNKPQPRKSKFKRKKF